MPSSNAWPARMMTWVTDVEPVGPHRLRLTFSDGSTGVRDFAGPRERSGPMVTPLHDPDFFARVFVEDGVPIWPNGCDWDPSALHEAMTREGSLSRLATAE